MMKYFIKPKFSSINLLAIIFIPILTLWKSNSHLYTDGRPIDDNDGDDQDRVKSLQNSGTTVSDTMELVMIRFPLGDPRLTRRRLRRRSAAPSKNYVVEIFHPKTNETMVLQISKSYSLFSPNFRVQVNPHFDPESNETENSLVISQEDLAHCIYSGEVTSNPGIGEGEGGGGGQVALSSCDLGNSDFSGFTGLITTKDGHWILEPQEEAENHYELFVGKTENNTDNSFPHSMQRAAALPSDRRCSSGNFHRPLSDYDEIDQNLMDSFDPPEENENPKSEIEKILTTATTGDQEDQNKVNQPLLTIVDGVMDMDTNTFKIQAKAGKNRPNSKVNKNPQGRLLELAIFSDSLLFDKMKKKYPKNTLKSVSNYITAQVNNMKLLYKDSSIGSGNEIEIRLNYLEILTKPIMSLKTGKGKESIYLQSFCNYAAARKVAVRNANWDHAMMLTGVDLRDEKSNSVLGVAWTAAMCDKKYSCSLIEASNFIGSYTMTHELGHSLGMNHDGEENNLFCSPTDYIMAAFAGPGQTTWSTCSQNNIREYFAGKSSIKGASRPKCLKRSSTRKKRRPTLSANGRGGGKIKMPGERYTATDQCLMSFGKKFETPIIKIVYPYDNICRELYCGNETVAMTSHPALEGTTCDTSKWCQVGKCVSKPE